MKKILILACLVSTTGSWAQSSKVVSAYNTMTSGEYDKAREYIDAAITNEKTMIDEKTWRYRGMIYQQIALSETDYGVDKADAVQISLESLKKAKELDVKKKWTNEIDQAYAQSQAIAVNMGVQQYNAQDYAKASKLFEMGADAAEFMGVYDTLSVYNAALSAEQAGNIDKAAELYTEVAESGYMKGKTYLYLANMYQKAGNQEAYLNAVKMGRAKYPDDADLIVYELNYYLTNNKFEEAENNLKLAIEKEPNNKQLYFSLGVVYDNLGNGEEAVKSYKKAIELDPNYFDANYNLGAYYFNQGVEMNNAANEIKDNKAYAAAREKAKGVFMQSRPYLEKAHELDPNDVGAIASLTQLYATVGETELYNQMKAKLDK
jgi:tetratricopeptide (TPR) repeat protein